MIESHCILMHTFQAVLALMDSRWCRQTMRSAIAMVRGTHREADGIHSSSRN
jgi:hypothetical protein